MTTVSTGAKNNATFPKNPEVEEMQRCVVRGQITDVPISRIVSKRKTYLPTTGHLCNVCCKRYCGVENLRVLLWLWDEFFWDWKQLQQCGSSCLARLGNRKGAVAINHMKTENPDEPGAQQLNYAEIARNKSLWYRFWKRFFDVVLSVFALIALSPVFLITAVLIIREDGFPVIFSQERNGLNGKVFRMYKFRSMCKDAPQIHKDLLEKNEMDGPVFKMRHDPRVTKVGQFIRRSSIDELPQLVNIIKGEMSIVGPRPIVTYEAARFSDYENQRQLVKPGLTCYWQVSGRNDTSFSEWMEMDLRYIRDASLRTDFKLICSTFSAILSGGGAY